MSKKIYLSKDREVKKFSLKDLNPGLSKKESVLTPVDDSKTKDRAKASGQKKKMPKKKVDTAPQKTKAVSKEPVQKEPKKDSKKDDKKKDYEPLQAPLPEVLNLETDELLAQLIELKQGWFGNPSKKLKSEIMKRLGVGEQEVFERGTLIAYSRIPDIKKKLAKELEKKAKEQEKLDKKQAKKLKKAQKEAEKQAAKAQKGAEKQAEKAQKKSEKQKKDKDSKNSSKKTDDDKSAVSPKAAALDDKSPIERAIEEGKKKEPDIIVTQPKAEIKEKKISLTELSQSSKKVPELFPQEFQGQKITDSRVSERLKYIEQALDEKKKYDAVDTKKKSRPKPSLGVIKKPFSAVGKAFSAASAKISHAFFVAFTTIISIPIDVGRLFIKGVGGLLQGIYKRVGGLSPFGWKKKVNQLVIYSGVDKSQEEITGIVVVNSVIFAIITFLLAFLLFGVDLIFSAVAAAVALSAVWIIAYAILNLMADKRADEVEAALPDVLQIVSANISAGMTPYNALWVSARKEFGALAEEIRIAQKETLGGKAFTSSLTEMGYRVRSNVLQRTLRLLIQGMKAGGELPNILQGIGTDIRQMRLLQKEMAANTMSYVLFIVFGMLIGAPLLFSVSIQFVDIINKFQPEIDEDAMSGVSGSGGGGGFDVMSLGGGGCPRDFDSDGIPDKFEEQYKLNPKNSSDAQTINPDTGKTYLESYEAVAEPTPSCITPGYLSTFAMIALASVGFFGSLLIGLIRNGKQSAGLKLMPLIILAALGMFWILGTGMSIFFGSMFG